MSVILKYGQNYQHEPNEVTINVLRAALKNPSGFVYGYVETWQVTGILQGDSPEDLKTKWELMQNAYAVPNLDVIWEFDSKPIHHMTNNDTLNGISVSTPVHFPDGDAPGELVNRRHYSFVIEGTFLFDHAKVPVGNENYPYILKYESSFSTTGTGGPTFGHLPLLTGKPQRQRLTENSIVTGQQSGMKLGLGDYPTPDPPLKHLAIYEKLDRRIIRKGTPRDVNNVPTEFPIHWIYTFERNEPFPAPKKT